MHYSENPGHCRVDFFKPSGKWYCTEVVDMTNHYHGCIHSCFKKALRESIGNRLVDMQAVCLEPYHEHSHPISITYLWVLVK